jgi:hypothetical protein
LPWTTIFSTGIAELYSARIDNTDADCKSAYPVEGRIRRWTIVRGKDGAKSFMSGDQLLTPHADQRADQRIAVFYGAADTCCAIAFAEVDEFIDYIRRNPSKPA